jgi:hypothetical protein
VRATMCARPVFSCQNQKDGRVVNREGLGATRGCETSYANSNLRSWYSSRDLRFWCGTTKVER